MHASICLESAMEEKCKIKKCYLMFCMVCMIDKLFYPSSLTLAYRSIDFDTFTIYQTNVMYVGEFRVWLLHINL